MRKYKQLELDLKFDDQPLTYKPGEHHFSLDPLDFNSGITPYNESSTTIANEHAPMDNNVTLVYKGEQETDSVHESLIKYKDELIESISNDGKYLDRLYSILQNINHYNLKMTYSEDELVKLRVSLLDTIASTASKLKDAINTLNGLKKY